MEYPKLSDLNGKTIREISGLKEGSESVLIDTTDGYQYEFYHSQDCCESVSLIDFESDDLTGALITLAEEVSNLDVGDASEYGNDSHTWTFYKIETNKGGLWMRWLGQSNGYYSESVDFRCCKLNPPPVTLD